MFYFYGPASMQAHDNHGVCAVAANNAINNLPPGLRWRGTWRGDDIRFQPSIELWRVHRPISPEFHVATAAIQSRCLISYPSQTNTRFRYPSYAHEYA